MLDGYVSEKEQIDAIRKWWQENGKFILIAVILGLSVGFGWRYWHKVETNRAENASMIYQSVLMADRKNDFAAVQGGAGLLEKDYASAPYASLAALLLAKESAQKNDLPAALSQLQWVISHSDQSRLQALARISTARILVSQNKDKEALSEVNAIKDKSFDPLVNWIKGDIAVKAGDAKAAQQYYASAKNALQAFPPATQMLDTQIAQPIG